MKVIPGATLVAVPHREATAEQAPICPQPSSLRHLHPLWLSQPISWKQAHEPMHSLYSSLPQLLGEQMSQKYKVRVTVAMSYKHTNKCPTLLVIKEILTKLKISFLSLI